MLASRGAEEEPRKHTTGKHTTGDIKVAVTVLFRRRPQNRERERERENKKRAFVALTINGILLMILFLDLRAAQLIAEPPTRGLGGGGGGWHR